MNPKLKPNWPVLLDQYRNSGLSRAEFCHAHKLSRSSFAYHAKTYEAHGPQRSTRPSSPPFISVRERSEFKLKINDTVTLSFDSLPDAAWVSLLIKSLEGSHAHS